jgi:hypothetical protein
VIKKPRERGGHSPRWAAEPEIIIIIIIIIIITLIQIIIIIIYIAIDICSMKLWLRHCATNREVAGSIPDGVRNFSLT